MKALIFCVGLLFFGLVSAAGVYGFLHNLNFWGIPLALGVWGVIGCLCEADKALPDELD